jgi:hypothetical protein
MEGSDPFVGNLGQLRNRVGPFGHIQRECRKRVGRFGLLRLGCGKRVRPLFGHWNWHSERRVEPLLGPTRVLVEG